MSDLAPDPLKTGPERFLAGEPPRPTGDSDRDPGGTRFILCERVSIKGVLPLRQPQSGGRCWQGLDRFGGRDISVW
ncbi:hypothetical protein HYQ46_012585 [Verticillium longisporum]|nr:hypothetical protein HYQ46_012585 [Verticillium longisporum]